MKFFFLFFLATCVYYCSIKNSIYLKEEKFLQDNFWLNIHTVQIIIEQKTIQEDIPISQQQNQSCLKAYQKSLQKLHTLYPKTKNIQVKNKVYSSMYLRDGGCKQIVHFSYPFLKHKI